MYLGISTEPWTNFDIILNFPYFLVIIDGYIGTLLAFGPQFRDFKL